jgi:hypothetical protein
MSLIGYAEFAAANVEITPDFSTPLDATLKTAAAQVSEGVVNAERPAAEGRHRDRAVPERQRDPAAAHARLP